MYRTMDKGWPALMADKLKQCSKYVSSLIILRRSLSQVLNDPLRLYFIAFIPIECLRMIG